jgi:hypothetical protein
MGRMPKVDFILVNGWGESKLWRSRLLVGIRNLSFNEQFTFSKLLLVNYL